MRWYKLTGMPIQFTLTTNPKIVSKWTTTPTEGNLGLMTQKGSKFLVWVAIQNNYQGTIIHEAVHVFQALTKYIGEDNPGDEWEAYTIEYIATSLIKEYEDALSKERQAGLQEGVQGIPCLPGTEEKSK